MTNSETPSAAEMAAAEAKVREFTAHEREVLRGMIAGHTAADSAQHLQMHRRVVEVHRARIMGRIGADSLAKLASLLARMDKTALLLTAGLVLAMVTRSGNIFTFRS